jgi:hypothetical protein
MTLLNNQFLDDEDWSFDISGALTGNSSLKKLVLYDYYDVFGSETFQGIPHLIRTHQDFETLQLLLSDKMTDRFKVVRLIALAAEGHASLNKLAINYRGYSYKDPSAKALIKHARTAEAIGTMLHNVPALREFSLSGCYMGSAGARHLADGLSSKNSVVEKLDLSSNKLGAKKAGIFARVLLANQNLKSLDLSNNDIPAAAAIELAVALRQNNTLELLALNLNQIGSAGASALADALVPNDALKDLDMQSNAIGDDGAISIAEMLTRNETIEKVCIGGFKKRV